MSDEIFITTDTPEDESVVSTVKRSYPLVPRVDAELISTAELVLPKWKASGYKIDYMPIEEFEKILSNFKLAFENKMMISAERSPLTAQLADLDYKINAGVERVKAYIRDYYDEINPASYYSLYGITKTGIGYKLPVDRIGRLNALQMMLKSIQSGPFADEKTGTAFWQDITDKYRTLTGTTATYMGDISKLVSEKDIARQKITDTLRSLTFIIRAQYPYDYKLIYRSWGFLR